MAEIAVFPDFTGYRTFHETVPVELPFLPSNIDGSIAQETLLLTLINRILARQRLIAWDHENHRHNGNGEAWQGASLIRTKNGRWFLQSNIHLPPSFGTRNCAETNTTTQSMGDEGYGMEIEEIFFMGGRADISNGIAIIPGEEGKIYTPCGSCRDVIKNWAMRKGQTKVTMLPLNDGSWTIMPYDGRERDKLDRNQAWTTTIDELLPELSVSLPDQNGFLKDTLKGGWGYIRDGRNWREPLTRLLEAQILDDLKNKSPTEALHGINAYLMRKLNHLYHNSEKRLKFTNITLVRTDTGEYHPGASSINDITPSTHPGADYSIGDMLGLETHGHVTDMVCAFFDFERFPQFVGEWKKDAEAPVKILMPSGGPLERLKKVASIRSAARDLLGRNLGSHDATIHVFMPNNTRDFNAAAHIISRSLRALLPKSYINPGLERKLAAVKEAAF